MNELKKISAETSRILNVKFSYYREGEKPLSTPTCTQQFDGIVDDGTHTFFRFVFRGVGYIGVIEGAGETARNYAILLPAYIESFMDRETELSKTEYLKRILLGECSSMGIEKYVNRFSQKNAPCFVLSIFVPKLMDEAIAIIEQYVGNSQDSVVKLYKDRCVLVKYVDKHAGEYQSTVDYGEFLAQSLKEELVIDVSVGIGPTVNDVKSLPFSYARAEDALRYAQTLGENGTVHSYRQFVLVKMLEDLPKNKLNEYLAELTDDDFREIFEDEDILSTAEAFLRDNLNVSEASRNLYMHRNTLLYRLDKIERATGLNVRTFSDAVSFRVLTLIYRLLDR